MASEYLLPFSTKQLAYDFDYLAPDNSEIRLLKNMRLGGLVHCSLQPGSVSRAVKHQTVEEIWYFIAGKGQVWRKRDNQEEVTQVKDGTCLTIPLGTSFQFKNTGQEILKFIISTMPSWPGADEAILVDAYW